jgi:N-acetylglucosamine kinase-like BadF-type ATPase
MMQAKPAPDVLLTIDAGGTSVRFRLQRNETLLCDDWTLPASDDGRPPKFLPTITQPDAIVAGITKVSRPGVVDAWKHAIECQFPAADVQIVPDYELAAAAAIDTEDAVMLLAGTGSLACVLENSKLVRIGGRGWEYGDEGSGAFITTELVRRCIRGLDGMLPCTPLITKVVDIAGTRDAGHFATWARSEAEMHGRGFLVPMLTIAAGEHDSEAINLMHGAGGWLARLARTAKQRSSSTRPDIIVIRAVGGLWETGPFLKDATITTLEKWFDAVEFSRFDGSHLAGGLRLRTMGHCRIGKVTT